ncbi:MAG: MATE family efflux transporter [Fuerstiella sp.]
MQQLPTSSGTYPAGSFRELFFVALPLIISAGSYSLMSVADRIMLAGYDPGTSGGPEALDIIAAVTPASMLHWTVTCIPLGTILYANTFISQYDGARRPGHLTSALWQAVWLAVVSGLLLMFVGPLSEYLFRAAGHSEHVVSQETAYFNILCLGSPALLISNALGCFFSGRRKTSVVMCVNVISTVVNIVLDYGLIFGHWGLPELGIRGAALATVLARCSEVLLFAWLIWYDNREGRYAFRAHARPSAKMLKKYLRYGVPSGMHYFVDNSAFLTFLFIVGSLNRDAMAATNLAFSINSLIFVPLLGFGTAVQTLVGHHIGASLLPAAVRTTKNAVLMGVIWTGTAAVLLVFFPELSLKPFLTFAQAPVPDGQSIAAILPVAAQLLRFVAFYSVFDALAVVFASALRGAGDTFFPMLITTCSGWLVMTVPAWLISQMDGATVQMLWVTCTAHIGLLGVAMFLRFLSGKWKSIHLV